MTIEIALLIIILITIIQLIVIIRYRRNIKFLTKLFKNPSLLDDYKWYAKYLDTKPLTDDEKRKAFNKAYIEMNEVLLDRTKERIKKEMEK